MKQQKFQISHFPILNIFAVTVQINTSPNMLESEARKPQHPQRKLRF
jgi:hypothetical protein